MMADVNLLQYAVLLREERDVCLVVYYLFSAMGKTVKLRRCQKWKLTKIGQFYFKIAKQLLPWYQDRKDLEKNTPINKNKKTWLFMSLYYVAGNLLAEAKAKK